MPTADREAIPALLSLTQYIDLCMPRGGEGLIRAVADCSKVPVIKHYKGVCHVFVDADADLKMAGEIVMNAKVQRPAVCNAMETLLVDKAVAEKFLPAIGAKARLKKKSSCAATTLRWRISIGNRQTSNRQSSLLPSRTISRNTTITS